MDETPNIPSILACDVGNSGIRLACVQGDEVSEIRRIPANQLAGLGGILAAMWADIPQPRKLVAGSVNPPALKALEAAADDAINEPVLVVGRDLPLPLPTAVEHPERVGVDRLCAAAAAFDRLGVACVIGDFGTAATIDCVDEKGVFLGGAIMPGLGLAAESLHAKTAQLPHVKCSAPDWVFGKNTEQAIIGGLVYGARGALRELVEDYATALGHWPVVVLTGGDAELICGDPNASELVQAIVPDLVLRGVAIAYYRALVK